MSSRLPNPPRQVCDSSLIAQGIENLARGILNRHPQPRRLALVGIHSGGDLLVRRVEAAMARLGGQALDLDKGLLDINFYRDDWSRLGQTPALRATQILFAVDERILVLIDDVIFTGRTVRAALEGLFSLGRPASIELAVLIDRGHREFPIEPDHVGIHLPTQLHQSINVYLFFDPTQDHALLENHKYDLQRSSG